MDLSYFIKLIKRRWLLIGIVSVVAAAGTFVLLSLKPREYYSRAQISAGITDNKQVLFEKSSDLAWNEIDNRFTNFLEFLNSKEVFSMCSYKLFLNEVNSNGAFKSKEYREFQAKFSKQEIESAKAILQNKYDSLRVLDMAIPEEYKTFEMLKELYYDYKILGRTLAIGRISGSDYIKVEVKTRNPFLSSNMVNIFCQEAIRIHNNNEVQRAEKSVSFFKELKDKKKADFENKLDSLSKLKSGNQVVDFAIQSEAHLDRMSTMEEAKNEETKKIQGMKKALASIDAQLNELNKSKPSVSASGNSHLNTTILHLKAQIERLNDKYINSGFKDKAVADSIAMYQARLERHINSMSSFKEKKDDPIDNTQKELLAKKLDYEIELSMAEAGLNTIEKSIYADRNSLSKFVTDEASMTPLQMATEVAKEEYMRTVDRYNEVRNEALKNGSLVRQIEVGQPADEPEPAKRILLSVVAAVSTTVLSLSVLFMLAFFDNTIKNPDNFIGNTGLPLLGLMYELPKDSISLEQIFFNNKQGKGLNDKFKEQLRNIRYELEKTNNQILLVTSLDRQEGKSFFISALAYSLILNYKRILIIDTNFKNNTLSELYKGKNSFEEFLFKYEQRLLSDGKDENLIGESLWAAAESSEDSIIHKTGIEGLDIISCKGNNLSPSEIFHGKRFEDLLEKLRFKYHYIIMEGPCLNIYSDTKELFMYCDKVLGVFAANRSIKRIDRESLKFLKSEKEKYMGSILNKVDVEDLAV
jgi:uncharacterized protein involved in exopolysaccharide biosynthesis/Mrp family chromosome partitioning ATPase